jgi:hypothetical protein
MNFFAGPGTTVLAILPSWSFPAAEWIAADPEFWRASPAARRSALRTDPSPRCRRSSSSMTPRVSDLAAILDRALTLLLDDIARRKCVATPRPRARTTACPRSRTIPAAVSRHFQRIRSADVDGSTRFEPSSRCGFPLLLMCARTARAGILRTLRSGRPRAFALTASPASPARLRSCLVQHEPRTISLDNTFMRAMSCCHNQNQNGHPTHQSRLTADFVLPPMLDASHSTIAARAPSSRCRNGNATQES